MAALGLQFCTGVLCLFPHVLVTSWKFCDIFVKAEDLEMTTIGSF